MAIQVKFKHVAVGSLITPVNALKSGVTLEDNPYRWIKAGDNFATFQGAEAFGIDGQFDPEELVTLFNPN